MKKRRIKRSFDAMNRATQMFIRAADYVLIHGTERERISVGCQLENVQGWIDALGAARLTPGSSVFDALRVEVLLQEVRDEQS